MLKKLENLLGVIKEENRKYLYVELNNVGDKGENSEINNIKLKIYYGNKFGIYFIENKTNDDNNKWGYSYKLDNEKFNNIEVKISEYSFTVIDLNKYEINKMEIKDSEIDNNEYIVNMFFDKWSYIDNTLVIEYNNLDQYIEDKIFYTIEEIEEKENRKLSNSEKDEIIDKVVNNLDDNERKILEIGDMIYKITSIKNKEREVC